ncbi:MAG: hypothetical protein VW405_10935 [Rhodospirillaceae bacterium]
MPSQDRVTHTPTGFNIDLVSGPTLAQLRAQWARLTPDDIADDQRRLANSLGLLPTLPAPASARWAARDGSLLQMLADAQAPAEAPRSEPDTDWAHQAISLGLRTVPAVVGGAVGALGGPVGMAAGGAFGGSIGEYLAQRYDRPEEPVNPWSVGVAGALSAVPGLGAGRTVTRLGLNAAEAALPRATSALADNAVRRTLQAAGTGMLLAPPSTVATNWAEGRPLMDNLALNTALGGAFGAGTGAAVEAGRAAAPFVRRAGDTLGDLYAGSRLVDETGAVGDVAGARAARQAAVDAQANAAIDAADDMADDLADDVSEEAVKGAAGWFPRPLKVYLDDIAAQMREQQRANWIAAGKDPKKFGPQVSQIQTAIKDIIRNDISKGDAREAQRLIDGYFTTALPTNYRGVNFDARRPVHQLFRTGTPAGGATFDDVSQQRLALAYEQGVKRAAREQWGDSRWLYHLSNGDPVIAVQLTRLLGAFSPGQKTDANTLNAIEAFLRSMAGESVDSILGRKVPDPARPGKMMRVGASLSTGHPRPSTVEDNLQRAMKLGRIFAEKVEALAGAELGLHDDIPIDLWLMRAIGASSDTTPQGGAYRLISEAMAKEAEAQGENPFMYMAKVWMGMQDIVGTPSPSFAESAARLRLPGHLQTPGIVEGTLGNIAYHAAGVKNPSVGEAYSVVATNPRLSFADWEREAQELFKQGKTRDVLGKKPIPKEEDLVAVDDYIRDALRTERSENMMRGATLPGRVIGNMPVEAAPGLNSGVMPGFRALPQDEQDKLSRSLLRSVRNDSGTVAMAEALFPDRVAPPLEGQGHYVTPQGVERNLMNTTPIEMETAPSGRRLARPDEQRATFVARYLASILGQDAVPVTSVQFDPRGGARNVVRVWPSAGEKMPRANGTIGSMLPPLANDDWVIQHRDTGADIFTVSGKTLSRKDIKTLTQAGFSVMSAKEARGAGSRAGRNIAKSSAYVTPDWGAEGSRQVTTQLIRDFKRFPAAERQRIDTVAMADAARVERRVRRDPNTSPSHLNLLRVMAKGGLTGVLKAMKDPSQAFPVLAALGIGLETLVRRQRTEPSDDAREAR